MRSISCSPSERREMIKLTGVESTFFFAWAMINYTNVFLMQEGFTASQTGLLTAIMSAVAIVASTFWGMVADRFGSIRYVTAILLVVGFALFALVPAFSGVPGAITIFFLLLPISNFFKGISSSFIDNLIVRSASDHHLNYGLIRCTGSLTFALSSFLAALYADTIGVRNIFLLCSAWMIIPVVLIFFCKEPSGRKTAVKNTSQKKLPVSLLLKNPAYLFFLVFTAIFYIGFNLEHGFLSYYLNAMGLESSKVGMIFTFRALFEVPFLLCIGKLRKKFHILHLIIFAAILMSVECFFFGFGLHSLVLVCIGAMIFGSGNGIFIGTSTNYIFSLAPIELKATAQAIYVSVMSASSILGNLIGGVIFDTFGAQTFYVSTGAFFLLSAVMLLISTRFTAKNK